MRAEVLLNRPLGWAVTVVDRPGNDGFIGSAFQIVIGRYARKEEAEQAALEVGQILKAARLLAGTQRFFERV